MAVRREQLYEEVWSAPMTTVAARYGVSSSFLARVCEQLRVPRPPRGHWAQQRVGRSAAAPPLPPANPGDAVHWLRAGDRLAAPTTERPVAGASRERATAKVETHPLLADARRRLRHGTVRKYDDETYVRPYSKNLVDIFCSEACVDRAVEVANAFFLALEDRGHRVVLAPRDTSYRRPALVHRELSAKQKRGSDAWDGEARGPSVPTLLFVDGVAIGLTLFESSEEVEVRYVGGSLGHVRVGSAEDVKRRRFDQDWTGHKWLVSGRLALRAYAPYPGVRWERVWREPSPSAFPLGLQAAVGELEGAAPEIASLVEAEAREAAKRRKAWELARQEEERRAAARRAAEDEAEREKQLLAEVGKWRLARDIRSYVAEVHALVDASGLRLTRGGPGDETLRWALAYAAKIDPLGVWSAELEAAKERLASQACPKCGKFHAESPEPDGE